MVFYHSLRAIYCNLIIYLFSNVIIETRRQAEEQAQVEAIYQHEEPKLQRGWRIDFRIPCQKKTEESQRKSQIPPEHRSQALNHNQVGFLALLWTVKKNWRRRPLRCLQMQGPQKCKNLRCQSYQKKRPWEFREPKIAIQNFNIAEPWRNHERPLSFFELEKKYLSLGMLILWLPQLEIIHDWK